jgi:hypothetical protein
MQPGENAAGERKQQGDAIDTPIRNDRHVYGKLIKGLPAAEHTQQCGGKERSQDATSQRYNYSFHRYLPKDVPST